MRGRVSIIIPVYNAEEFIEECFCSILEQTYPNIQLIIVDDASEDASPRIINQWENTFTEHFAEIKVYYHKENMGQAAALNTALPHCNGEYLMWMDADDLLAPENISHKVQFLEKHPKLQMVRTNGIMEGMGIHREIALASDKKTQSIFEDLLLGTTYCMNGCYMVRMEALLRLLPGLSIPVSREGQNMQLLLPVASVSDCGYIDENSFTYRLHPGSHSRSGKGIRMALSRIAGFELLYLEIIQYCNCDKEKYSVMIRENAFRQKLEIMQTYNARVRQNKRMMGDGAYEFK